MGLSQEILFAWALVIELHWILVSKRFGSRSSDLFGRERNCGVPRWVQCPLICPDGCDALEKHMAK